MRFVRMASSGGGLLPDELDALEGAWARAVGSSPDPAVHSGVSFSEGQRRKAMRWHRHREKELRERKIANVLAEVGELRCEVPGCCFVFESVYGEKGAGYVHVHHLSPLSLGYRRTTVEDLAIVCANCHAMIHVGGVCRPLQGLLVD